MDRLQTLSIFARVAEMESFTAAARSLGLPKATASNAVQQLEARLATRLLHRTTRRVHLTHDGAAFYERCKDLLADVDELDTMFQKSGEALAGRIRVDMSTRLARFTVIPALPAFLAEHPSLDIELGSTDRAVDLVREGYDCVVRAGALVESGLVARRVGEFEVVNCASPGYLREHGKPRGLRDLERHVLVHYVSTLGGKLDGWEYEEDGEWKELPMRGQVTVNNAEAYVAAAVAGLGLIQTPVTSLEEELASGRLVEVLPRLRARPMPVSILYPHRRQLSRRVRVFMDWLEGLLAVARTRRGGAVE
jgi:DNA-binding transcriptional LysR family regulator